MADKPVKSREIRLFLSSTFRDMNAERDYLVKCIFPQIKEYCESRFLKFVAVDLRWGITEEESRNGLVLSSCIEEVDNCRPFFIGILGSRYGWSPTATELKMLRPSLDRERDWIERKINETASITEMEIDYAVLRDMDIPHAAFFIRADSVEIDDDFREECGSEAEAKLVKLKAKIRAQSKYPVNEYESVEQLGEMVRQQLMEMIDSEYPVTATDRRDALVDRHEKALEHRADVCCDISSIYNDFNQWLPSGERMYIINGEHGIGTSTAMCYGVKRMRDEGRARRVFYYDFAQTDYSRATAIGTFNEFVDAIIRSEDGPDCIFAIDNSDRLGSDEIKTLLETLHTLKSRIVIAAGGLSPVVSMTQYMESCPYSTIHGLTKAQRRDFVVNFCRRYRKTLSDAQVDKIIPITNSPTFLTNILKRIVDFGHMETLDEFIDKIAADKYNVYLSGLLKQNLEAVKQLSCGYEYGAGTVGISLMLDGISEDDLVASTNMSESKWVLARPYVRSICSGNLERLTLLRRDWGHECKMYWSTPYRAKIGHNMIRWYLVEPSRLARGYKAVSQIYRDIWHLPFDEVGDEAYEKLKEDVSRMALSPDCILSLEINELNSLLNTPPLSVGMLRNIRTNKSYGRQFDELSTDDRKRLYERIVRIACDVNGDLTAMAYEEIAKIEAEHGETHKAALSHAEALMAKGRCHAAIEYLDGQFAAKPKGFAGLFRKSPLPDSREAVYAQIMKIDAYMLRSEFIEARKTYVEIEKTLPKMVEQGIIGAEDADDLLSMARIRIFYMCNRYGTNDDVNRVAAWFKDIDRWSRRRGLDDRDTCLLRYALIINAMRSGRGKSVPDLAMWAGISAALVYGAYNNYHGGRVTNLRSIVNYHETGEYNDGYAIVGKYNRRYDLPLAFGEDWENVDLEVRKTILDEDSYFIAMLKNIVIPAERSKYDENHEQLRKRLKL